MKKIILAAFAATALTACGGGGGNGNGSPSTPTSPALTHNQLAEHFVNQLNATGLYDVDLAKSSTLRSNFIVIYDHDLDSYDAINIDNYAPGMDVLDYVDNNAGRFYYDLDVLPGHYEWEPYDRYDSWCECWVTDTREVWIPTRYRDRWSGFVFEKIKSSSKDLETFAALAEEATIANRAESVATKFGLSVDRSREVVRLAMAWQKQGGKNLTDKDQDAFSKELLGFSITEAKAAAKSAAEGNVKAMDQLIEEAAITNSTSPEHVRQIIGAFPLQ